MININDLKRERVYVKRLVAECQYYHQTNGDNFFESEQYISELIYDMFT